jgi:hypothetical protein
MWVEAVDSSYDTLTEDRAHALKAAGIELYIQALSALPPTGLHQPPSRVISLRNATYAGLKIAGYALISGHDHAIDELMVARRGVPDDLWDALEFCAIDVETSGITVADVSAACEAMRTWLPNKPSVIYTSYNQWVNVMGNPPHPANALLWNASWGTSPGSFKPYGGWTRDDLLLHQYSGNTTLHGQTVDRNVWWVADAPTPQPGPLLIEQLHIDQQGGAYLAQAHISQLDRIERKLDELLRR